MDDGNVRVLEQGEHAEKNIESVEPEDSFDDVWLEEVIEPEVTSVQHPPMQNDDQSPLERLLQSISSDEQWVVDENKSTQSPLEPSRSKMYHDPATELWEESEDELKRNESDHDSGDEVNTSPPKSPARYDVIGVTFVPVVLFRYLLRRKRKSAGIGGATELDSDNEITSNITYFDNEERTSQENREGIQDREKTVMDVETAVNFPLRIWTKLKIMKSSIAKNHNQIRRRCPLCGQPVLEAAEKEFQNRRSILQIERLQPGLTTMAQGSASGGIYKTEIRIGPDGARSVTESFFRSPSKVLHNT